MRRRRRRLGLHDGGHLSARSGRFRHERHRLLRRGAIGLVVLVLVCALAGAAGWFYLGYELDHLPRVGVQQGLLQAAKSGAPYDVLLVASSAQATRADLLVVARVVPAAHSVELLAVPPDLVVRLPNAKAEGPATGRIGDALGGGTSLLVRTVETSLDLPVEHVVEVSAPGFQRMVDALGGVYLDFPMPVIDQTTGLHVGSAGCQKVGGAEGVQLTRTTTPFYFTGGSWHRQTKAVAGTPAAVAFALLVALLDRARPSLGNPLGVNDLVGAASGNVRIDSTWGAGALRASASLLADVPAEAVGMETVPTRPAPGAADRRGEVLSEPGARDMLSAFTHFGTGPPAPLGTTAAPTLEPWLPSGCSP